jgi:hypothetical protein
VCRNWEGYEKWFERKGLIIWARKKKIGFGGRHRLRYKGYYGGICDMERCEYSKSVGGIPL